MIVTFDVMQSLRRHERFFRNIFFSIFSEAKEDYRHCHTIPQVKYSPNKEHKKLTCLYVSSLNKEGFHFSNKPIYIFLAYLKVNKYFFAGIHHPLFVLSGSLFN